MENSRTCEISNVNVRRASYVRHLRSKKLLEKIKQNQMIIPEWLFIEEHTPIKNKIKKVYNPKTLKQMAGENIKVNDKELDKQIAKRMTNPYYFIVENIKLGFRINLKSQYNGHANSFLNIIPNFPDIGIETRCNNKILKKWLLFMLD